VSLFYLLLFISFFRMVTNKIDDMMKDRSDYKSFYYRPISANHHRVVKESMDRQESEGLN